MSDQFRELLKKVGSGQHTKKDLTRSEAATAMAMMLRQEATPAQIGAFMIAHRIKRPTGIELAGMLDAYDKLGTKLPALSNPQHQVRVLGIPYDGRSRTAPISPITALILAVADVPVIMHGGDRIPTKYGLPLIEIWQGLGLNFAALSEEHIQQMFNKTGFAYFYTPKHFPLTQDLVTYREQIGKRPPLATVELIWSPYQGEADIISGYVHPPTATMIREAFNERGETCYTLVKGLEGSIDLRLSQTTIIAVSEPEKPEGVEYLKLNPRDYGFAAQEIPLESTATLLSQMEEVLQGKSSPLMPAAIWNGGFYLWHCGICPDLETGFKTAESLLTTQQVKSKVEEIKDFVSNS
jgi:anthranilate phosphoribosyltransferase